MRALLAGLLCSSVLVGALAPVSASAADWGTVGSVNERISGVDRFDTAAAISRNLGTKIGGTVVLATGTNFPDSLSAAPLAAKLGAPLLLTLPNDVPQHTMAELRRLAPKSVIIVGGEPSVSNGVFEAMEGLESAPKVRRIAGADRFETSAFIAAEWGPQVQNAFVVTGSNYPDALAAGPAAAKLGGPVILVPGTQALLPAATQEWLKRSGVQRLFLAGSESSISPAVASALTQGSSRTIAARYAGADRFETSELIATEHFPQQVRAVYLATGSNFPDALAGASAAAVQGGPLILSVPSCIPSGAYTQIDRLKPQSTYVLGDESTLSRAVLHGSECAGATPNGVTAAEASASQTIYEQVNAARFDAGIPAARLAAADRQTAASSWSLQMASTPTRMAALNPNITAQSPWVKREYVQKNPTGSAGDHVAAISHAMSSSSGSQVVRYQPANARVYLAASWVHRADIGWLSLYAGV